MTRSARTLFEPYLSTGVLRYVLITDEDYVGSLTMNNLNELFKDLVRVTILQTKCRNLDIDYNIDITIILNSEKTREFVIPEFYPANLKHLPGYTIRGQFNQYFLSASLGDTLFARIEERIQNELLPDQNYKLYDDLLRKIYNERIKDDLNIQSEIYSRWTPLVPRTAPEWLNTIRLKYDKLWTLRMFEQQIMQWEPAGLEKKKQYDDLVDQVSRYYILGDLNIHTKLRENIDWKLERGATLSQIMDALSVRYLNLTTLKRFESLLLEWRQLLILESYFYMNQLKEVKKVTEVTSTYGGADKEELRRQLIETCHKRYNPEAPLILPPSSKDEEEKESHLFIRTESDAKTEIMGMEIEHSDYYKSILSTLNDEGSGYLHFNKGEIGTTLAYKHLYNPDQSLTDQFPTDEAVYHFAELCYLQYQIRTLRKVGLESLNTIIKSALVKLHFPPISSVRELISVYSKTPSADIKRYLLIEQIYSPIYNPPPLPPSFVTKRVQIQKDLAASFTLVKEFDTFLESTKNDNEHHLNFIANNKQLRLDPYSNETLLWLKDAVENRTTILKLFYLKTKYSKIFSEILPNTYKPITLLDRTTEENKSDLKRILDLIEKEATSSVIPPQVQRAPNRNEINMGMQSPEYSAEEIPVVDTMSSEEGESSGDDSDRDHPTSPSYHPTSPSYQPPGGTDDDEDESMPPLRRIRSSRSPSYQPVSPGNEPEIDFSEQINNDQGSEKKEREEKKESVLTAEEFQETVKYIIWIGNWDKLIKDDSLHIFQPYYEIIGYLDKVKKAIEMDRVNYGKMIQRLNNDQLLINSKMQDNPFPIQNYTCNTFYTGVLQKEPYLTLLSTSPIYKDRLAENEPDQIFHSLSMEVSNEKLDLPQIRSSLRSHNRMKYLPLLKFIFISTLLRINGKTSLSKLGLNINIQFKLDDPNYKYLHWFWYHLRYISLCIKYEYDSDNQNHRYADLGEFLGEYPNLEWLKNEEVINSLNPYKKSTTDLFLPFNYKHLYEMYVIYSSIEEFMIESSKEFIAENRSTWTSLLFLYRRLFKESTILSEYVEDFQFDLLKVRETNDNWMHNSLFLNFHYLAYLLHSKPEYIALGFEMNIIEPDLSRSIQFNEEAIATHNSRTRENQVRYRFASEHEYNYDSDIHFYLPHESKEVFQKYNINKAPSSDAYGMREYSIDELLHLVESLGTGFQLFTAGSTWMPEFQKEFNKENYRRWAERSIPFLETGGAQLQMKAVFEPSLKGSSDYFNEEKFIYDLVKITGMEDSTFYENYKRKPAFQTWLMPTQLVIIESNFPPITSEEIRLLYIRLFKFLKKAGYDWKLTTDEIIIVHYTEHRKGQIVSFKKTNWINETKAWLDKQEQQLSPRKRRTKRSEKKRDEEKKEEEEKGTKKTRTDVYLFDEKDGIDQSLSIKFAIKPKGEIA